MKLLNTTLLLILIAASPAFSLREQNDQTTGDETNYKEVNGFSGYLTLDDDPREKIRRWLDPIEIETLSAMPTMKRGRTMGAFVELRGCKRNAQGACNARVNYTIYKPDDSIFATHAVGQRGILWKKQAPPATHRNKPRNSSKLEGPKMSVGTAHRSKGLARMYFKFLKDDPMGEYKVTAEVTDLNADITFELELNFYLKK